MMSRIGPTPFQDEARAIAGAGGDGYREIEAGKLPPVVRTGNLESLRTYADGIYYDRNQARCYRFTYGGSGTLAVTMTPTGGQDFFLELIGPTGIVAADTTQPQGGAPTRSITRSGLPAGDYIVRVRAGYTTSDNTAASYSLGITLQ